MVVRATAIECPRQGIVRLAYFYSVYQTHMYMKFEFWEEKRFSTSSRWMWTMAVNRPPACPHVSTAIWSIARSCVSNDTDVWDCIDEWKLLHSFVLSSWQVDDDDEENNDVEAIGHRMTEIWRWTEAFRSTWEPRERSPVCQSPKLRLLASRRKPTCIQPQQL